MPTLPLRSESAPHIPALRAAGAALVGLAGSFLAAWAPCPAQSVNLFYENFDALPLGPVVTTQTETPSASAWTDTPPAGWTVDDSGVPTVGVANTGVTEFEGWSFVDKAWWIATAADQGRSGFVDGSGVVAVADPDEWDDLGRPTLNGLSPFQARMTTPAIALAAAGVGAPIQVALSSSWRPEGRQTAILTAVFDDPAGTRRELLRYESDASSQNYKPDTTSERRTLALGDLGGSIPAGATSVRLEATLADAGNNWWWALDELSVFTGDAVRPDAALRAVFDRDTGRVEILNGTGAAISLRGYSIVSRDGALDEQGADFLAPADGWLRATRDGDSSNDLSELNLGAYTLPPGGAIDLGAAWLRYSVENADIAFHYLTADSDDPVTGVVRFVGGTGSPFDPADLDRDGAVTAADWERFRAGYGRDLSATTPAGAQLLGDLDGDGRHTASDFVAFQAALRAAGAPFAPVPEPESVLAAAAATATLSTRRRPARSLR